MNSIGNLSSDSVCCCIVTVVVTGVSLSLYSCFRRAILDKYLVVVRPGSLASRLGVVNIDPRQVNCRELPHFVSGEDCKKIIKVFSESPDSLQDSLVIRKDGSHVPSERRVCLQRRLIGDSQNYKGPEELREIVERIHQKLANQFGCSFEDVEGINLIYYPPNRGKFDLHYDYLFGSVSKDRRQRVSSAVIYLNTLKNGGQTVFPILNKKVQAEEGKLLQWNNCDLEHESLYESSVHEGASTKDLSGKWIMAIFILGKRIRKTELDKTIEKIEGLAPQKVANHLL